MSAERLRGPRQFRLMFMATMAVLSVTLAWLGWQLFRLDEQLDAQRQLERRDAAADLAVAALEKRISAAEQELAGVLTSGEPSAAAALAHGAVIVAFQGSAPRVWPSGRLVYYPELPEPPAAPAAIFSRADELELQRDYAGALGELRVLAASGSVDIRALAIVRIARSYLKSDRPRQALDTYERLAALGAATVGGMPAALAANVGALAVYERQRDRAGLDRTARVLDRDLHSGRWAVASGTYEYLSSRIVSSIAGAREVSGWRLAISEAVDALWHERQRDSPEATGRRSVTTSSGPVLLVWRSTGQATAVFAASTAYLDTQWLAPAGLGVALVDSKGRVVAGHGAEHTASGTVRVSSVTGLPWTVAFVGSDGPADAQSLTRRRFLVAGLGVLLTVVVTGAWFVGRSVARELDVARLQSDFVSAVSHEFRTPLTTLCQLSELLKRGRVTSDEDKQTYYEFLHGESDRLRRLVEGLLNFGRLQTGKAQFQLETVDAAALVQQSADDFTHAQRANGHRVVVHATSASTRVQADREALRCALWNLLENAAKYSPGHESVRIDVRRHGPHVEIAVQDDGIGIPRAEQRRIFDRFTRGSGARDRQISGTGIGLATRPCCGARPGSRRSAIGSATSRWTSTDA